MLKPTDDELKNIGHTVGAQMASMGAPPFMLIIVQTDEATDEERFSITTNLPEKEYCRFFREAHEATHADATILARWNGRQKQ